MRARVSARISDAVREDENDAPEFAGFGVVSGGVALVLMKSCETRLAVCSWVSVGISSAGVAAKPASTTTKPSGPRRAREMARV